MMLCMDELLQTMRAAQAAHAAAIRTGDEADIRSAFIATLRAERAFLLDCGGADDIEAARELEAQIADELADAGGAS